MNYQVRISKNAVKKMEVLPKSLVPNIYEKIRGLEQNPRPAGCKKLVGYENLWRIRIGEYRIIYSISDSLSLIEVRKVLHRKDAY